MGKHQATEEQISYANLLDKGMKMGILMLLASFLIYVFGFLSPFIPFEELPDYWGKPVNEYLEITGIHPGWSWLGMLGKGDFLNFVGIAFLAGITIVCYIAIIPVLFRKKDKVFGVIAILEVLVLTLAASGILKSGGH